MNKFYILGPEGTFSSMTVSKLNGFMPMDVEFVKTIPEVFFNINLDAQNFGIVPTENMSTGNIGITLELLQSYPVNIIAELFMDIRYALIHLGKPKDIKRLYVFSESYHQCSSYIFESLPNYNRIDTNSNIDSFCRYREDACQESAGAIIPLPFYDSENLGQTYPAVRNVQNDPENYTRFIIVKKSNGAGPDPAKLKTSLFVDSYEDRPSLLYDILKSFHDYDINLDSLHSKPSKKYRGNYGFFIDFINKSPDVTLACLNRLKDLKIEFRVLGTYNKIED